MDKKGPLYFVGPPRGCRLLVMRLSTIFVKSRSPDSLLSMNSKSYYVLASCQACMEMENDDVISDIIKWLIFEDKDQLLYKCTPVIGG